MIDLARHAPHFPFLVDLVKIKKSERHIVLGQKLIKIILVCHVLVSLYMYCHLLADRRNGG